MVAEQSSSPRVRSFNKLPAELIYYILVFNPSFVSVCASVRAVLLDGINTGLGSGVADQRKHRTYASCRSPFLRLFFHFTFLILRCVRPSSSTGWLTFRFRFSGGSPHANHSPYFDGQSSSNVVGFSNAQAYGGGEPGPSMSQGIGSYGVPGMNMNNSPMMISTDDSLLFPPGNGVFGTSASPSRPASGSAMATTADVTAATSLSTSTGYNTADDCLTDPALVEPHISYYFESVVSMQYVFGVETARGVLRSVSAVPRSILVSLLTSSLVPHPATDITMTFSCSRAIPMVHWSTHPALLQRDTTKSSACLDTLTSPTLTQGSPPHSNSTRKPAGNLASLRLRRL